jgi:uncharacterized LabA/DUF88 family protein
MPDRVTIFIDGYNFFHCLTDEFHRLDLDYHIFAKELTRLIGEDARLVRVYYYDAPVRRENNPNRYEKQQRFLEYLRDLPQFRVELGRLEGPPDNLREKGVDIRIATDMLQYIDIYDVAILVTGDGDFSYVVRAVQDKGKQVVNAIGARSQSRELRQTCDFVIIIDNDLLDRCARNQ